VAAKDETEGLELCRSRAFSAAAEWVLRSYGPEIAAYLLSLEHDRDAAQDVFAECCAAIWQGLPRFRGECSLRTYSYAVARRQWARAQRTRARRGQEVPLDPSVETIAERLRTTTAEYLRTEPRDRLAQLRDELAAEDRALLMLRLNRKLGWVEIARVVSELDEPTDEELARAAAGLRKRYERLKEQFRRQLRAE
jgi:RNA polymerase sigma-70 factor (ECF subfamily)